MLRHKFNAKPTQCDGIKFSSKKEAKRYTELRLAQQAGLVEMFLRQVPFHLPAGIKYICDFMVFWQDGSVTVEDVKGYKTDIYILKKKQVETIYPIEITEI
jgi:hypothetical protein